MHAYVINLPASKDRRALMVPQLEASGLEYEFVDAVDGRALSPEDRARLVDEAEVTRYPQWLTPGAIGCALSHQAVYERIVATRDTASVVLEDDAILPPGFSVLAEELAGELRADEILLLNFRSFGPCKLSRAGATTLAGHQLLTPVEPNQVVSSLAYLIGSDAAASLAAAIVPVQVAADCWHEYLSRHYIGSLRVAIPQPVRHQVEIDSTLGYGDESQTRRFLKRREIWPIPQLRAANRKRVARSMSRVEYVD